MKPDALDLMKELLSSFFHKKDDAAILNTLTEDVVACGLSEGRTINGIGQVREYLSNETNQSFRNIAITFGEEKRISDTNAYLKFVLTFQKVCVQLCVSGVATPKDGSLKLSFLHFAWENPAQTKDLFPRLMEKRTEESMIRDQQMKDLFENLPGGVAMHRWDGSKLVPLYISKGFSELCGEDGRAMFERTKGLNYDIVHLDDLPGLKAFIIGNIEKTERMHFYRYRIWNKKLREYIWIQITGKAKRQGDGTLIVYVNYVDVNAEVKATESLRSRMDKERQRMLGGDKKLTAYSITDVQKGIIVEAQDYYLNSGIKAGDTCEAFNGKMTPLLNTREDRQRFVEMRDLDNVVRQYHNGITEWKEDLRWRGANGYVRWQRSVYSIAENDYSGELYLYCYLYDVLEEKIMMNLFSGIQENMYLKTGVISLTTGQLYAYDGDWINHKLSISDYETTRRKVETDCLPEDAPMVLEMNSLENIKKQLSTHPRDFSFVYRAMVDGELKYHQIRYAYVPGESDLCICVVKDITEIVENAEQKNAELQKALADAEAATQAKSEFLSRMSHEIRTPMNAIMGMTAIAKDNKSDFLQVFDCLNKIDSSSRYLLTLINDILEMSRIESGTTNLSEEKFEFSELISEIRTVVEPLAHKSGIRLDIKQSAGNDIYYGDHIRIQQVILNLLGNAIKFTKPSGRVRLEAYAVKDTDAITVFEFLVEDTGIGMSEAFMERMFEPFSQEDSTTTSKYGGSGLGLAISKSLVEAMGGTIAAESMVGIGTNFTVQIPLKKVQSTVLRKPESQTVLSEAQVDELLRHRRILMVEDQPMNVMIEKRLLERKEVLVVVAENGKIAVDLFHQSPPNEYDAILMDIRMPVMDGLEATRQIRALERSDAKSIPIIAVTANALEEDRNNSKSAGMNDHLAKPIDPKKMYQMLAEQIARRTV